MDAEALKLKAIHCRKLAAAASDEGVGKRLVHMAEDYDARAAAMAAEVAERPTPIPIEQRMKAGPVFMAELI